MGWKANLINSKTCLCEVERVGACAFEWQSERQKASSKSNESGKPDIKGTELVCVIKRAKEEWGNLESVASQGGFCNILCPQELRSPVLSNSNMVSFLPSK